MIKHIGVGTCLALCLMACQAKEQQPQPEASTSSASGSEQQTSESLRKELYEKARKRNGGKEPTRLDLTNELYRKALEQAGAIKDYGAPRVVEKGAKPEIVLKGSSIYFNSKLLKLGDTLERWKKVLGEGRCRGRPSEMTLCIWDEYGLEVGTEWRSHPAQIVNFMEIQISLVKKDPAEALFTTNADGSPSPPTIDWRPAKPFPGYLEIDQFGIDAKTKFWEIRSSVDISRNLRCGLRDCRFPKGAFGKLDDLSMHLTTDSEQGTLESLRVGRNTVKAATK